jgi:hypothetical protein
MRQERRKQERRKQERRKQEIRRLIKVMTSPSEDAFQLSTQWM